MIQICRKDKEKVYEVIRTGKIDVAEMPFPNLIEDIILTMKRRGLLILLHKPCRTSAETTAILLLDCTKVLVNLDNDNYENSFVVKTDGGTMRGYKMGVLRGILEDWG